MFSTWFFKNIARLVLFSYSLQLVAPAHAGWTDDPSEAARFRSGLRAKVKVADPFAEVASKKDMPTLTIQTIQGDAGKWGLTVTQTSFDKKTSLFTTDYAWRETYSLNPQSTLVRHPWQRFLALQLSETGALSAQTVPQTDTLNPYYGAYNYVFNTAATNLTLLNLVTGGFVDVQDAAVVTTKHLEAHVGVRLKANGKISNTSSEGQEKACILSKGQIFLKTPCLDTQRGHIEGETILGFLKGKDSLSRSVISLNTSNGSILANTTQIFSGGVLNNGKGKIGGRNLFDLSNEGVVFNTAGQLWGHGDTAIQAGALLNTYGAEVSGKNLTIIVNQRLRTDETSHLIADQKIRLTGGRIYQASPFSAKTVEVHAVHALELGSPQFVENLSISVEKGELFYPPDGLQASKLLSITAKTPLTLTIPVNTPGAFHVAAPEIINETTLAAKDEVTLTGSSSTVPFPVRNDGNLVSKTKGITINGKGFSHEAGGLDVAGNFDFKGENLKFLGQTTIGGDIHLGGIGQQEIDYSKLSVNGLLHITLPENKNTLPHAFKTPGQILLDRAGNSVEPLHILHDLIALKGVEIHLPPAELIIGAEANTQPMVKIQAKEGPLNLKSKSLDIAKAQLYSKVGMFWEVKERQIHIGRGVVENIPMFEHIWHPEAFGRYRYLPFKSANETLIMTEGDFTVISPQGVLIDLAEITLRGKGTIITEQPVRNEGGKINVSGKLCIDAPPDVKNSNAIFQNCIATQTSNLQFCMSHPWPFIHPYSKGGEVHIDNDLEVKSFENFGSSAFIGGKIVSTSKEPAHIQETDFVPSTTFPYGFSSFTDGFYKTWIKILPPLQRIFSSTLTIAGGAILNFPKEENGSGQKPHFLQGILQAPKVVITFDGKLEVGQRLNYRRPAIPPFQQILPLVKVHGGSAFYKDDLTSPKPWIRRPVVPMPWKISLPPAVIVTPQGLRLKEDQNKFLFCPWEEVSMLSGAFEAQLQRGCLDWEHVNNVESYVFGRQQAYKLYQEKFAPKALPGVMGPEVQQALIVHGQNNGLSKALGTLTPEDQEKLKFMILYSAESYEGQDVYMPLSWLSKGYDNPKTRNPDGGVFGDVVFFQGLSDGASLHNLATIHGEDEATLDVKTITNERQSYRWIEYRVNEHYKKGNGWFSNDKYSYEVVAIPCSETQHTTGILSTGAHGKLGIKAKVLKIENGAEVLSGDGGTKLLLGEAHSTPSIDTYVVRSEGRTRGAHVVQHGQGATMHPAVIGSTGGIEGTIGLLHFTGTHVLEKEKDINLKMRRGHLGASIADVFNGITVEGGRKTIPKSLVLRLSWRLKGISISPSKKS